MKTKVLIGRKALARRVGGMGREVSARFCEQTDKDLPLIVMPVMDGAMMFASDLLRELVGLRVEVLPIRAKSYQGMVVGDLVIEELPPVVAGRKVLIVEDILDTGQTLTTLVAKLSKLGAEVFIAVLLDKHKGGGPKVDFRGFYIEDHFVIGYGLDLDGLYRNLPDILEVIEP